MWRYVKNAFLNRVHIPFLGALPVNIIALAGLGILGFGNPGFWLLAVGLEAGYLWKLVGSQTFRDMIDLLGTSSVFSMENAFAEIKRQQLIESLNAGARERYDALEKDAKRILQKLIKDRSAHFIVVSRREALQKLGWAFLKLLIAHREFINLRAESDDESLRQTVRKLEEDLQDTSLSDTARASKEDTLAMCRQRLENAQTREMHITEIESDLARIEAQVDLALENVMMQASTDGLEGDIRVAKFLLDPSILGTAGSTIQDIEDKFGDTAGIEITEEHQALLDAADKAEREMDPTDGVNRIGPTQEDS